jgi:hypothetical protein
VRPAQVSEKQRVSLQESDDRIEEIREQDRKSKNDDDPARDVDHPSRDHEKQVVHNMLEVGRSGKRIRFLRKKSLALCFQLLLDRSEGSFER